jgi:hypothetical protein
LSDGNFVKEPQKRLIGSQSWVVSLLCCFLSSILLFQSHVAEQPSHAELFAQKRFWRGAPAVRSPFFVWRTRAHSQACIDGRQSNPTFPASRRLMAWHTLHAPAALCICVHAECVRIGHTRLAKFLHNEAPAEEVCRGGRW